MTHTTGEVYDDVCRIFWWTVGPGDLQCISLPPDTAVAGLQRSSSELVYNFPLWFKVRCLCNAYSLLSCVKSHGKWLVAHLEMIFPAILIYRNFDLVRKQDWLSPVHSGRLEYICRDLFYPPRCIDALFGVRIPFRSLVHSPEVNPDSSPPVQSPVTERVVPKSYQREGQPRKTTVVQ